MALRMFALFVYRTIQPLLTFNLRFLKAWSSADSFPSRASNGPTLEQYRTLSSQLNETKRENSELVKHNQLLSAKLDTLAYQPLLL